MHFMLYFYSELPIVLKLKMLTSWQFLFFKKKIKKYLKCESNYFLLSTSMQCVLNC